MEGISGRLTSAPVWLVALIALQAVCIAIFTGDALIDLGGAAGTGEGGAHLAIETLAALGLVAAIVVEVRVLRNLLRRKARLEQSLARASAAVAEVIEWTFDEWGLTPAERDVATLSVKGLNTAEIAEVRGSAEGTIKAHLNAIYRKSGTRSRAELLSVLIDTLMDGELPVRT